MYLYTLLGLIFATVCSAHPQKRSHMHTDVHRNEISRVELPNPNATEIFESVLDSAISLRVESWTSSSENAFARISDAIDAVWTTDLIGQSTSKSTGVLAGPTISHLMVSNTNSASPAVVLLNVYSSPISTVPLATPSAPDDEVPTLQSTSATTSPQSVAPAEFFPKSSQAVSISFGAHTSPAASVLTTVLPSAASSNNVATSVTSPSGSISSPGTSSGKKGLSYADPALTSAFAGTGMSWAYNWAASPGGSLVPGVEFIPMLWGQAYVTGWSSDAAAAISAGSTAAFSFNEPDIDTQSNIDATTAAHLHIEYMNPLNVRIGSPAISNGVGTSPLMGIDWLNAFFTACAGECKVDFVAFHWYDVASNIASFKQHVTDVIATAAANGIDKVWLTEFGTTGGDDEAFLRTVMPFLDSTPQVEKYAYFMCAAPQMLTGSTLNGVGQVYANG